MKTRHLASSIICLFLVSPPVDAQSEWPTGGWQSTTPQEVGLDAKILASFDAEIADGKYGYVDSMLVIRHGKVAYERYYEHDYKSIYSEEARTPGALVVNDPTGPYNYFNAWWHPYYHKSTLHTMQSVTKSVVSVVIGIAIDRNEFPDLDTPVLSFFEPGEVANVDDRKRRMTIRHLLTMSTGLDWNEDLPYTDPKNAFATMALSKDWVQYTIDRPMAENPGEAYQYNSGATLILGQVFRKATGFDLEEYALKYLFAPLGIDHYFWKRTPMGLVDTQEGLYVTSRDIAKIAYLILMGGQWDGQQVVSEEWVKASVKPSLNVTDDHSIQYGYKWWLYNYQYKGEDRVAIAGSGFGGQAPIVLPELDIVLVFTGWNILPDRPRIRTQEAINRILEAVRTP